MIKYCFYFISILIFFGCQRKTSSEKENVINLGDKREIFVDHYLIDKLDGTSLKLQKPVDQGPVFYFDKPWEGKVSGMVTIIKDKNLYRMYFRGLNCKKNKADTTAVARACYAESTDGIHWERPALGLVGFEGSTDNNILFQNEEDSHNFSPFIDTNPDAPSDQKYKAISGKNKNIGIVPLSSPDGIHWQRVQDKPVITDGVFDSQNVAFWSENEKCYVCYFRTWTEGVYKGFRSVSRATSPDFIHWSETQAMTFGENSFGAYLYTTDQSIFQGTTYLPGNRGAFYSRSPDHNR